MSEALSYAALCKMVELFHVWFVLSMNNRVYWGGGGNRDGSVVRAMDFRSEGHGLDSC